MKPKLLALLLLAGSSLFARSHFSFGIGISPGYGYYPPPVVYEPPPPPVRYVVPAYPGPDYSYVDGYWQPAGPRWAWRTGYWARRPHPRAVWVRPRYYRSRWYRGYWR